MEKNVFLRLAEERYTTKHYNGKMIPREQFATLCEILRLASFSGRRECDAPEVALSF